tara:strand:+ start:1575 stop:1895 length:321 start_codon:yes stop_codon:yes gene_type:complete
MQDSDLKPRWFVSLGHHPSHYTKQSSPQKKRSGSAPPNSRDSIQKWQIVTTVSGNKIQTGSIHHKGTYQKCKWRNLCSKSDISSQYVTGFLWPHSLMQAGQNGERE